MSEVSRKHAHHLIVNLQATFHFKDWISSPAVEMIFDNLIYAAFQAMEKQIADNDAGLYVINGKRYTAKELHDQFYDPARGDLIIPSGLYWGNLESGSEKPEAEPTVEAYYDSKTNIYTVLGDDFTEDEFYKKFIHPKNVNIRITYSPPGPGAQR